MKPIFTSPVKVGEGDGDEDAPESFELVPLLVDPPLEHAARTTAAAAATVNRVVRRRLVIPMTGSITRLHTIFNTQSTEFSAKPPGVSRVRA
jgi:hypothetical protein